MTIIGRTEWIAGWCFDGWTDTPSLTEGLLETVRFVGLTDLGEPIIRELPEYHDKDNKTSRVLVLLHNYWIMGTASKTLKNGCIELRVRILLSSGIKFNPYLTGMFIKVQLGLPMISRGTFSY